jgi:virulence-associated protein VapD
MLKRMLLKTFIIFLISSNLYASKLDELDLSKMDKDFHFMFKKSTLCGSNSFQINTLYHALNKKIFSSQENKCNKLLEELKSSFIDYGISLVGGCHVGERFVMPSDLKFCTDLSPNLKLRTLNLVNENIAGDKYNWAKWNIFYADISKDKKYLVEAKKTFESYYAKVGGQQNDKLFLDVLKRLGDKPKEITLLGYWHTETGRYEFTINQKIKNKMKLNNLKNLIQTFSKFEASVSYDKRFNIEDKLLNSQLIKELFDKSFYTKVKNLESLVKELKNTKKYDHNKSKKVENAYSDLQNIVKSALEDKLNVKMKYIQEDF